MSKLEQLSKVKCFDGYQYRFKHFSVSNQCEMTFSIYLPEGENIPSIYWLSGLTCTDENFVHKAGAQKWASEHGVALIAPDTSPRGEDIPDDLAGAWDFGLGAGFYLNATQTPWDENYRMYDYITNELPALVESQFPVNTKKSIMGHSMGGHGALTIALKNPDSYQSVSAFSPICNPIDCAWGQKAFLNYLGDNKAEWENYDTCKLVLASGSKIPLFIDQGRADDFMDEQLKPNALMAACRAVGHPLELKYREGYDHSYYYISTFIGEHIAYHAENLKT